VKREDGYPVFAVYEDGVWVYTDTVESGKGVKGGFAVGGFNRGKGSGEDYMRVTPDSIRFYIRQDEAKGVKGGFAVGGYRRGAKGGLQDFFNVSGQNEVEAIEGENRVIWYPRSNAFLAGNVLVLPGDTVGENSLAVGYQVKASGDYSQAFGYQSIAHGLFSTAIGKGAVAFNFNSVSIGNASRADGINSFAFGTGALAMGHNSYAFGSTGLDSAGFPVGNTVAFGEQSFAFGLGSESHGFGSVTLGTLNRADGEFSTVIGYNSYASDGHNIAMGHHARATGFLSTAIGSFSTAEGHSSIAIGEFCESFGIHSTTLGFACLTTGEGAVAIGSDVQATGMTSVALGRGNQSHGEGSLALGNGTWASGDFSTTLGFGTRATGENTLAIGRGIEAMGSHSVAIALNDQTGVSIDQPHTMAIMGGRVGINIINPDFALQLPDDPSPEMGSAKAFAWETYSDERIKMDQQELDYGLAEILALQPKQYDQFASDLNAGEIILKENHISTIGLVAQDVHLIIPEAVSVPADESTDLWSMDYSKIIPVLVKAIQDQQEIIGAQQELASDQQRRLSTLELEIGQLKSLINAN
ncbi:MAG: tail fiber domain-containing protein, partial [Bacteroidales bacterium]|nr:tail fiber domain-containing protein [Bacteroidales bacterium]